jgi:hypothetical protein
MNDEKIYEKAFYIIIFTLGISFASFIFYGIYKTSVSKSENELFLEEETQLEFKGKVIEEYYREGDNHNVKVEVLNDGYEYRVMPEWERLINVGDSISKKKDSLYVILIKAETGERIKLDYEEAMSSIIPLKK